MGEKRDEEISEFVRRLQLVSLHNCHGRLSDSLEREGEKKGMTKELQRKLPITESLSTSEPINMLCIRRDLLLQCVF